MKIESLSNRDLSSLTETFCKDLKKQISWKDFKVISSLSKEYYYRLIEGESILYIIDKLEELEFICLYNTNFHLSENNKVPCEKINTVEDIKKHYIALFYAYQKLKEKREDISISLVKRYLKKV